MDQRVAEKKRGSVPRRIAIYTDAMAWGGAEVYMTELAEGLKSAGYETPLFVADRPAVDAWVADLEERGFAVTRFRHGKEFDPRVFAEAGRFLAGFELVHFNKTHPRNCLPGIAAARAAGARSIVATEHLAEAPVSRYPFGRQIVTAYVRRSNRQVDRTIAVSELSRRMLIENYSLPADRVVAIPNGIDATEFDRELDTASVRAGLGLRESDLTAVLVGALIERKGQRVALEALAMLSERLPNLRMVFVGDGEKAEDYRRVANELGVADRVVWAGFRRDVPAVLQAADMLILPSDIECLPFVILEAMGARLPVVASDVGGVSEEVEDGVTGRLVPPRNARALADAMADVLGRTDRGAAMGEAGRRKLERDFSIEACVGAVLDLYDEVCSASERSGR